jgi:hypothetical protein
MASTYGRLLGNGKEVTRLGGPTGIRARLETYTGSIGVWLNPDGSFVVQIGEKESPDIVICVGNVNSDRRHATGKREGKQDAILYGTPHVRQQHAQ